MTTALIQSSGTLPYLDLDFSTASTDASATHEKEIRLILAQLKMKTNPRVAMYSNRDYSLYARSHEAHQYALSMLYKTCNKQQESSFGALRLQVLTRINSQIKTTS